MAAAVALVVAVNPADAAQTTTTSTTSSTTTTTTTPPGSTTTTTVAGGSTTTTTTVPSSIGIAEPASASNQAVRLTPPLRTATIISDSAMAGVRWNGALRAFQGFIADDRLESCRRLVFNSCRGREGYIPLTALQEVQSLPDAEPTDVLVISTGYNDSHYSFASHAALILDAAVAKGYQTIAWVTYRVDVDYELPIGDVDTSNYSVMNDHLNDLLMSGQYPALRVWDLNSYASNAVGWFYSDGVHERRLGSFGVADWVSRHMAALDGRPCALPWSFNYGQEQQCMNPDRLPAERGYPAIAELYGL